MQLFEVLLFLFVWLVLLLFTFKKLESPRQLILVLSGVVIITSLHSIFEGLRWQMLITYLMAVVVSEVAIFRLITRPRKKISKRWLKLILSGLILVSGCLALAVPWLFQPITFADLTGTYHVGTLSYQWTDPNRLEDALPETKEPRTIMVKVWYPTDETEGETAPYFEKSEPFSKSLKEVMGVPSFLTNDLKRVKTRSLASVSLSDDKQQYPVLVFSHGFMGYENQNTFQLEELASQGYVVVAINHTYQSVASIFLDGSVHYFDQRYQATDVTKMFEKMDALNEIWLADSRFVLDKIEELNQQDPRFSNHLDLANIGMFGHSFGGATTLQALLVDDRVKAGINMDGALYGEERIPSTGLTKPFLQISADQSIKPLEEYTDQELKAAGASRSEQAAFLNEFQARNQSVPKNGNYWLVLKNSNHLSFSDFYLLSPQLFGVVLNSDVRQTHQLVNHYTLDFFDHYLKNKPLTYLNQPSGEYDLYSLRTEKKAGN
ncbi:dienelactone hydrolase family protein [Vagococcus sp. BWB3-3]|uniref:Dienelactone hydrolase family protein n=1 Tax=Vagococcus allomyrinae TaxID=2794353 RepID=A0A940SUK4_9ENTE|nr:dienelactone hydrolase family protein [Vagococcus allomyrinae]MBP1040151.1 dienelactone hydrolase family protein [Vagococcus allomyrinae]